NSSSTAGKSDASNSASNSSGDSTYSGNSSLAYTIEGRYVAIKDLMQDGDGKNYMALFINKVTNEPGGRVNVSITNSFTSEVFNFSIANTGATTVLHSSPSLSNFTDNKSNEASYMSSKLKNYYGDSVVVTITDINATHVAGTFSGKYLSSDDKPIPLEITEGSFDVPFTKDAKN
ncbi:MAG TPA: hypothetical protein VIJ57_06875, partial [Hanamia sp.]